MAKWSSQHNGKFPDPYSKLKLDEEKLKKKKKKKKDKNRDRDSILSQIDPNTNKVKRLEGGEKKKEQISDKKKLGGLVAVVVVFTRKWSVATREQEKQHKKPKWKEVNTFFQIK